MKYFFWVKSWNGKKVRKRIFESHSEAMKFLKYHATCCIKLGYDAEFLWKTSLFRIVKLTEEAAENGYFTEGEQLYEPHPNELSENFRRLSPLDKPGKDTVLGKPPGRASELCLLP